MADLPDTTADIGLFVLMTLLLLLPWIIAS